jgi:hypothetical protein
MPLEISPVSESHPITRFPAESGKSRVSDDTIRMKLCALAAWAYMAQKAGQKERMNQMLDEFGTFRDLYLLRHPGADIDGIISAERSRSKILR